MRMNGAPRCVTPEGVKSLPAALLPELAENVRRTILDAVSANGGHLSASLGAVELAIALLRIFNPSDDKVLWDVGHQAYAWKILTGRGDKFGSLRLYNGISGFPNPSESPYDAFIAGHAGSALAAATGMAAARDRLGGGHVVAVVGDASLANGESLEALNACASLALRLIVVVNDNSRLSELSAHTNPLPFAENIRRLGPVDGHDIEALTLALQTAKEADSPVLIHVVTEKGKGFPPAEKDPSVWHGVGPFDVADALAGGSPNVAAAAEKPSWSDVFGNALVEAARKDPTVCAVVAAMKDGTGLNRFAKEFPDRFFDVGICEGMAVTFAAGLAKAGMKPVVAIYSTFLQRAIGQIQHDVCLQGLPVVFAVDRAGCVGADGCTHHGLYDIALLKPLAGMSVLAPVCAEGLKDALASALAASAPVAIRYPKGVAPVRADLAVDGAESDGGAVQVRILALGDQVAKALDVKRRLAAFSISAVVEPVDSVKPLPAVDRSASLIVSIENGAVCGGFGESVGVHIAFGWPDAAVRHGTVEELERECGFDAQSIAVSICRKLGKSL